jgi:hypothetical protein
MFLAPSQTYRIKITGFETELTPKLLGQLLNYENEKQYYINRSENRIGYIVKLQTVKFAKRLFLQWHNQEIEGGHKLKCQLELNNFSRKSRNSSCQRSNCSGKSSRSSSLSSKLNSFSD